MQLISSKEVGCNIMPNGEIDNIATGNEDAVDIPCNDNAIGTFHTHTDREMFSHTDIKSAILHKEQVSYLGVYGCIYKFNWNNMSSPLKNKVKLYRKNLRRRSLLAEIVEYINSHMKILYE